RWKTLRIGKTPRSGVVHIERLLEDTNTRRHAPTEQRVRDHPLRRHTTIRVRTKITRLGVFLDRILKYERRHKIAGHQELIEIAVRLDTMDPIPSECCGNRYQFKHDESHHENRNASSPTPRLARSIEQLLMESLKAVILESGRNICHGVSLDQ